MPTGMEHRTDKSQLQAETPKQESTNSEVQSLPNSIREVQDPRTSNSIRNTRLLIVDDHAVVRRGVTGWLNELSGFEVVGEAETAQEGVTKAVYLEPDVVLMDVGFPGEGGSRATSQIVRACSVTKVVAFTASGDPVDVRGMLAAGAMAYVLKRSEPSTVLSAIRAVCSGSRFLDPGLSNALIEELNLFPGVSRRSRDVLTLRESQVLEFIVWGYTSAEIATVLSIKTTTVNTYRIRLCEKLGLRNRAEIVRYGISVGLVNAGFVNKRPPRLALEPAHRVTAGEARGGY